MSGSQRPPNGGRLQTAQTTATQNAYNNDNYTLAGPPHPGYDPSSTYFDEGYREANPWMETDRDEGSFSLARTFPHTVRWKGKKPGASGNAEQIAEDGEKGEAETAPQVPEARGQGIEREQREAIAQDQKRDQRSRQQAAQTLAEEDEEEEKYDSQSTTPVDSPPQRPTPIRTGTSHRPSYRSYEPGKLERIPGGRSIKSVAERGRSKLDPNDDQLNTWSAIRQRCQRPLAEWLGTTILIFIGICSNLSVITSNEQTGSFQSMYWCWGFAVMLAIYIAGGGSGAFLNPALTIMLSVFRGFPAKRVPVYILAQLLGAFTGALLAFAVYRDNIFHFEGGLNPDSTGAYVYTQPKDWVSNSTAFFTEMLGTAIVGCSILALGDSHNSPPGAGMHAFIIGLLTTTVTMALGYSTGGCFNPVRDLGPRLASIAVGYPLSAFTARQNWWIWGPWCATVTGALLGALVYDLCIFKGGESPVNYTFRAWKLRSLEEERGMADVLGLHKKAADIDRRLEDGTMRSR
ncbi:aquaporin-like protein [Lecanosticta acicola]|uniref:Aquaporin-like protein n=1 Tax=Lecanosticta acicola TaxID=111012 RepID=A0AAI9E9M0_9PEZI|nr:aquaporin-like protein [Lecanosticta acicola]